MKLNGLFSVVASVLIASAAVAVAADKPKTPTTKPAATQPSGKPVNKFCAVEGKDHDVDPKVTVVYKGKTIGFCCKDCIEEFEKDPERYVKKLE